MRMGKGKGTFDHWATRVAVNKILFEIRGQVHEKVVRDAFRLAGNKLPGESHHPSCTVRWNPLTPYRSVRVCKERRPAHSRHHEAGRSYPGRAKTAVERAAGNPEASLAGSTHKYNGTELSPSVVCT